MTGMDGTKSRAKGRKVECGVVECKINYCPKSNLQTVSFPEYVCRAARGGVDSDGVGIFISSKNVLDSRRRRRESYLSIR